MPTVAALRRDLFNMKPEAIHAEVTISGFYCRDVEYCKLMLEEVPKNHRPLATMLCRCRLLHAMAKTKFQEGAF